jgi:hypothetical protein
MASEKAYKAAPTDAELLPFVRLAAVAWYGQKDRETFPEDLLYFERNWMSFPGFRAFVKDLAERETRHGE